jgi:hypothetical protein
MKVYERTQTASNSCGTNSLPPHASNMWGSTSPSTLARMCLLPSSRDRSAYPRYSCSSYPNNPGHQWVHQLEIFVRQGVLQLAAPSKRRRCPKLLVGRRIVGDLYTPGESNDQHLDWAPTRTQQRRDLSGHLIPLWMGHGHGHPPSPTCLSAPRLLSPSK